MQAKLDYISVTLNNEFTWHDWLEYAEAPIFDEETGAFLGQRVPKKFYRVDRVYKHIVLSCFGDKTEELAFIARHLGMTVTRLDICLDIFESEVESLEEKHYEIVQAVNNFNRKHKRKTKSTVHGEVDANFPVYQTHTWGARSSDSQLRIYRKSTSNSDTNRLRIEFQLRAEFARSAWDIAKAGTFQQGRLRDILASIEAIKFEPGLFGIDWQNSNIYELDRSKDKVQSSRADWIITQVLPACLKEFNETGEDLTALLAREFRLALERKTQDKLESLATQ